MADSVVKLRIDTKEYDANIKRASQVLSEYFNKVREGGGTLKYLDDGVLEAVQAMGQMSTKCEATRGAMRELTQATTDMTIAYRNLTDEERSSPLGAALKKSISELTERAGSMRDAVSDVAASINHAASDTRRFDQISGGISLMTSGYQTLAGAAKIFGIETKDNVEVLATLQAAMAVTNGLQTAQNLLQSQSALMMGVQAAQASLATAAQSALAAATGSATLAQKAFNAVASINPYVLLAGAIAAVGIALYEFTSSSKEAEEELKELEEAEEKVRKKADETRDSFLSAAGGALNAASRLSNLQDAYRNANSEMEKTGILKQAQAEFKKLGIECNGVTDAQRLLVRDGAKVIELIQLQGNVAAVSALRMEAFKKSMNTILQNRQAETGSFNADDIKYAMYLATAGVAEFDKTISDMQNRAQNLRSQLGIGSGKTGGGRTGKTGKTTPKTTTTTPKKEEHFEADSIMAYEKEIAKLEDEYKRAGTELREFLLPQIDALKEKLKELKVEDAKIEWTTGINIQSDAGLSEYINSVKKQLSQTDFGSTLYKKLAEELRDSTTLQTLVAESLKAGLDLSLFDVADEFGADFWTRAMEGGVDKLDWDAIVEKINKKRKENGLDEIKIDDDGKVSSGKNGKNTNESNRLKDTANTLSSISGGVNSISSGLSQLGIELPRGLQNVLSVLNGITSILSGISALLTIINSIQVVKATPVIGQWLAGGGQVRHAANGYYVGGNNFSGDMTPIMANAGEVILNKAQQGVVAAGLQNANNGGGGVSQPFLTGQIVYLGINNHLRATGQGEIVTTKMLKRYGVV